MVDNNIGITAYKGTNKLSDVMMGRGSFDLLT